MINIYSNEESYHYDIYSLVQAFYPNEEIVFTKESNDVTLRLLFSPEEIRLEWQKETKDSAKATRHQDRLKDKTTFKKLLYNVLTKETNRILPWGTLTGIRPTKLALRLVLNNVEQNESIQHLQEEYLISEEKARLAYQIAAREAKLTNGLLDDSYSLYIGIPFCPTICAYCSFSSSPIDRFSDKVDAYIDAVEKELNFLAEALQGRCLTTIYIGGGTPTTLSAKQLERLFLIIKDKFNLSYLQEFTVEAGRPDSIHTDQLALFRSFGVNRVSVNPQTMQQATLERIGRHHRIEDINHAVELVRSYEISILNMDLIIGLPGESITDMRDTLTQVLAFSPENVTIHSLARKRASRLVTEDMMQAPVFGASEGAAFVREAEVSLAKHSLYPYYLYRQKQITGNLENVGYAKIGTEGLYNVLIMEELHPIIAVGAGASSKYVTTPGLKPMRSENVKDVIQYITRIDEMIQRKREKLEEMQWL